MPSCSGATWVSNRLPTSDDSGPCTPFDTDPPRRERSVRRPPQLRLPAAAFGLALLLAVAAGCGGGDSTSSTSELLTVSSRDGDYAIFGMNADGQNQHRLTDEHGDPSTPAGLEFQIEPSWSPDGTMIAFASSREGSSDIYVMNEDGTGTRRLTSSAENDQDPSWSSDGERIVFDRSVEGGRLFVMDADGGGQRRLTDDTAEEGDPAWSPDGSTIAYSRREPGSDVREIWLVDADGSNPRQLTKLGAVAIAPAWAPDGTTLAFAAKPGGTRYGIYTITLDGGGPERVVTAADDAFEPAYAPDGQSLAYFSGGAIFVHDATGADTRLTDPDDNDSSPAWNPMPTGGEEADR